MQMRLEHGRTGGKVFRYSDETAEAVASGEKLLKESQTVYESFADMMSPDDANKVSGFSGEWKQRRIDKCRAGRSRKRQMYCWYPRKLNMRMYGI